MHQQIHYLARCMSIRYKTSNPEGIYFITIPVTAWIDIFTRTRYADIVLESLSYCRAHKGLLLYAYVIMYNHIHLIAAAREGYALADILRDFKKFSAKAIIRDIQAGEESRAEWLLGMFRSAGLRNAKNKEYQFWQPDNHPIELYNNTLLDQKMDYVHNNPVKARYVSEPHHFVYSSAGIYAGLPGDIEIDVLE